MLELRALTGVFRGKYLRNELSPYIFNKEVVDEFLKSVTHQKAKTSVDLLYSESMWIHMLRILYFEQLIMNMTKISICFFNDREVRAIWDEGNTKWWYSVPDIIGVLNE